MTKEFIKYRAHTNIALIKYWGKRQSELFLPMTSSLSLTLDAFYTETQVQFIEQAHQDEFILNGMIQSSEETQKISRFIQLFREQSSIPTPIRVESYNHVPTAAGLASSASAFAALGLALNDLFQLNIDRKQLSTFVRQGSGSATRSLYGGFVIWDKGYDNDSQSSYSYPIDEAQWDIHMLVVAINTKKKKISSRIGMQATVETSPFYRLWPEEVENDLAKIIPAIKAHDFQTVGEIAEHNAMKMHATTLAANPSITYFQPESIIVIQMVHELRQQGIPCYITMDAGPNVKILCQSHSIPVIKQRLLGHFTHDQLILASPGPDPKKL